MNLMIPQTLPQAVTSVAPAEKAGGISRPDSSFAEYFDRRMSADKKNILGTGHVQGTENSNSSAPAAEGSLEERQALADLLAQLMIELKAVSREEHIAPGEWVIPAIDSSLFDKIIQAAGLDEDAVQELLAGFGEGRDIELAVLLDVLARNFIDMADTVSVKIPDTELPFVENILIRMGFGQEELAALADMTVGGDDFLDLGQYLEGLQKLVDDMSGIELVPVNMSDWEKEQLTALLTRAGVEKGLAEQMLAGLKGHGTALSFDKLSDILARSVSAVKDMQARIDLPPFLAELNDLLAMSGYQGKEGGWTPVVLDTMENLYRDLFDKVDMKSVRIQWSEKGATITEDMSDSVMAGELIEGEIDPEQAEMALVKILQGSDKKGNSAIAAGSDGKAVSAMMESAEGVAGFSAAGIDNSGSAGQANEVRQVRLPQSLSELQQQAFDQISKGVISGLRNNDHHLVLKLYPPELGEVKVDLLIRNDQVAVSFSMENSRVKEALEAGMNQFRENLEQQGFNLGECMVSVGGGNESDDAWQRFANEWRQQMSKSGAELGNLSDLPDDVFYHRVAYQSDHEGGINVLV